MRAQVNLKFEFLTCNFSAISAWIVMQQTRAELL